MGWSPEHDNADIPVVVGRRSARLSVIVPITIRGTDVKAQTFKENTWTISVNKHGARLATFHQLTPGDLIVIENLVLGRTAKARVTRVGEKRFPEDPHEIAVELLQPRNVWGVKFPPEDWQQEKSYPPPARAGEKAAPPPPTRAAPVSPAVPRAQEAEKVGTPPAAVEPNEIPEEFSQFNLALTALSRYAQQAAGAGQAPRPAEEKGVQQPELLLPSLPTALQEALRHLEEKAKMARSLEEQLEALAERLQASRSESLGFLLKAEGVQQSWTSQLEKIRHDLEQARSQTLQSALEELDKKIQEKLAAASSGLVEEARKQILDEASTVAESVRKETAARLAELTEESIAKSTLQLKARQVDAFEQAKVETARFMESMIAEVSERFRQQVDELLPSVRADTEKSLRATAEELLSGFTQSFREQMQNAARGEETAVRENVEKMQQATLEEAERASEQLRQIAKQETQNAATAIAECVAQATLSASLSVADATARLQTAQKEIEFSLQEAESCHKQLGDLAASALASFRHEAESLIRSLRVELEDGVRQARERSAAELFERVHKLAEEVLESSATGLQRQVQDARETLSEQLAALGKRFVAKSQEQLDALREAAVGSLTREAQASGKAFHDQLGKTLQEFQERHAQGLDAFLQATLDRQRGILLQRLQEETESSSQRAAAQLKTKGEQIAQGISDTMYKQVGVAVLATRDWAEGTRAVLEARLQTFQKQMEDARKGALERQRTELETLTEGLRQRLQGAAQLFQAVETIETAPPKVPGDFSQAFTRQPLRSVEEELERLVTEWRTKQEQAVREAEEAFRRRLAEILRAPTRR